MKFVLVNGRTPYPQTFCMLRCESIKSGYLCPTTTQYPHCDYECYSHYCESVARLREDLAGEEHDGSMPESTEVAPLAGDRSARAGSASL